MLKGESDLSKSGIQILALNVFRLCDASCLAAFFARLVFPQIESSTYTGLEGQVALVKVGKEFYCWLLLRSIS